MVANSDKVDKDIKGLYFDFCFAIGKVSRIGALATSQKPSMIEAH
jgi:hypothetical protein